MSNPSDFVIEDGVLIQYKGQNADVIIPEGVTGISKDAFSKSESIKSISIPKGVKEIAADTFSYMDKLANVVIPDGLEKIGSNAFIGCQSLTCIALPASLKSIGRRAFRECSELTELHVSDIAAWCMVSIKDKYAHPLYEAAFGSKNVMNYDCLSNRTRKIGNLFCKEEPVKQLVIPDGVTQIGPFSFCNCANVENVHIPKTLKQIGEDAFLGCGIKKVYIDDLRAWCRIQFHFSSGTNPLSGADELIYAGGSVHALEIPDDIREIGGSAFEYFKGLTSVTIPSGVTSIGNMAFEQCPNLTSVTLPEGMKHIGRYAFDRCERLTGIVIPDSVMEIGSWAFQRCKEMHSVTLPDSVTVDQRQPPFEGCRFAVTVKHWSPLVTKALASCEITAIHTEDFSSVPSTYRALSAYGFAMEENKDLSSPRAAEHMAYIKKNARKLRDLMFTNRAAIYFLCEQKLIGAKDIDAFLEEAERQGDAELKALLLGYQNELGMKRVSEARARQEKTKEDYADQLLQRSAERDERKGIEGLTFAVTGKLYTWSSRKEIQTYLEEYGATLAAGITRKTDFLVTNDANSNSEKMLRAKELNVEILSERAFNQMIGRQFLEGDEVVIPDWVKRIEPRAFKGNGTLKRVRIPNHIVEIPMSAFSGCQNLSSVEMPAGVTKIDELAFFDCQSLTDVVIPEGVTEIGSCAFKFCHTLKNVMIPNSAKHICDQAFCDCGNLTSVTIPEAVEIIGSWAFDGCSNLTSIVILGSETRIQSDAFHDCPNLTIHAPAGSYAERYAEENGIPFVELTV